MFSVLLNVFCASEFLRLLLLHVAIMAGLKNPQKRKTDLLA